MPANLSTLTPAQWGQALAIVAAIGAWFVLLWVALALTRPPGLPDAAPTQDLGGDEPPAVVSLLANRWTLTEDAAESTLLDLGARGFLELRQPGNEPRQTTIHLAASTAAGRLSAYEERVLEHVRGLAIGGVIPLTALTFRDPAAARWWTAALHTEIVQDARTRGLSQRRLSARVVGLLGAAAAVPAVLGSAVLILAWHAPVWPGLVGGFAVFAALSGHAGRPRGERPTAAGREAARAWAGLAAYLRVDEAFGALPPSAVAVWDRYLAYGDALGMTHVCAAVIDLGLGNRRRVWSSFGGSWHQVRVHYRAARTRYGTGAFRLAFGGFALGAAGFALLRWRAAILDVAARVLPVQWQAPFVRAELVLGAVALALGGYRLVRVFGDLVAPRTLTGEVLWIAPWRSRRTDNGDVPFVHYLAVDDGSGDRTTAWALPSPQSGECRPGDVVQVSVRRWSRRIVSLSVQRRGAAAATAMASDQADVPGAPAVAADRLGVLSAAEVSSLLGRPVSDVDARQTHVAAGGSAASMAAFRLDGTDAAGLVIAAARGLPARLMLRSARGHNPVAGVGEEAYSDAGWLLARSGDTTVRIMSPGGVPLPGDQLARLAAATLARASGATPP